MRDSFGNNKVEIDARLGTITLADPVGAPYLKIQGENSVITVGQNGDITVFRGERQVFHLDVSDDLAGVDKPPVTLRLGAQDAEGNLIVRDLDGRDVIKLQGGLATLRVGNYGNGGHVSVEGKGGYATIELTGASGDIRARKVIACDVNGGETIRLDGASGDIISTGAIRLDRGDGFSGNLVVRDYGKGTAIELDGASRNITVRNAGGSSTIQLDGASGNISAYDLLVTSDVRLKADIRPVTEAMRKLQQLRGVEFAWRRESEISDTSRYRRRIGVIAQEVESVAPELVGSAAPEGYKSVDLSGLVGIMIEGFKELVSENRDLKRRIAALEGCGSGETARRRIKR